MKGSNGLSQRALVAMHHTLSSEAHVHVLAAVNPKLRRQIMDELHIQMTYGNGVTPIVQDLYYQREAPIE